jgi:hypothetical protein
MIRLHLAASLAVSTAAILSAVGLAAEALTSTTPPVAIDNHALAPPLATPAPAAASGVELAQLRLREGTRLNDRLGHFRISGDSLTFIEEDGRELGGLPNLNLERVLRTLKTVEEPEAVMWSVSGAVTEFSARNYLLITRAVYKAATPPAPETLEVDDPSAVGDIPAAPAPAPGTSPSPAAHPLQRCSHPCRFTG